MTGEPTSKELGVKLFQIATAYVDEMSNDDTILQLAEDITASRLGFNLNELNESEIDTADWLEFEDQWSDMYYPVLEAIIQGILTEMQHTMLPMIGGYERYNHAPTEKK